MSDTTPPPSAGSDPYQQGGSYGAPPPSGQPYYGGGTPSGPPPPNHLVWAILSTLFCCLPLGVVSIVFAAQVNGKWNGGDVAGARDASNKARTFALWSTIIGVVVGVLYVILVVALGGLSMNNSEF
jgi:predicted secreted protein